MTRTSTVNLVVTLLGLYALIALGGTIYLIDHAASAASVAVVAGTGGTALGSLASVLATTRSAGPDQPQVPFGGTLPPSEG